ncbi:hypothetical protein ACFT8P_00605 [Streptomyces sp. NPDC057101]|uniref:hypothetical protein n=1 Tax=Streptomyces sp. NPDC057101 TaxID=3346020 RepID=UPI0036320602
MNIDINRALMVPALALVILGGTSTFAFAEVADPAPVEEGVLQPGPPAEEDESRFMSTPLEEEPPPMTGGPSGMPAAEHCAPKNVYKPTANQGKRHAAIGVPQANYNGTSRNVRSWFKAEVGGSYTIYSNCRTSAKNTVTTLTPWHVGWNIWES